MIFWMHSDSSISVLDFNLRVPWLCLVSLAVHVSFLINNCQCYNHNNDTFRGPHLNSSIPLVYLCFLLRIDGNKHNHSSYYKKINFEEETLFNFLGTGPLYCQGIKKFILESEVFNNNAFTYCFKCMIWHVWLVNK